MVQGMAGHGKGTSDLPDMRSDLVLIPLSWGGLRSFALRAGQEGPRAAHPGAGAVG